MRGRRTLKGDNITKRQRQDLNNQRASGMSQPPESTRSKAAVLSEPLGRGKPYPSLHLRLLYSRTVTELFALLSATQTKLISWSKHGWDPNVLSELVNLSTRDLGMWQPRAKTSTMRPRYTKSTFAHSPGSHGKYDKAGPKQSVTWP